MSYQYSSGDILIVLTGNTCFEKKGYKSPDDEDGAENMILEGEQSQAHVGKDEILCQEVKNLKELHEKHHIHQKFNYKMIFFFFFQNQKKKPTCTRNTQVLKTLPKFDAFFENPSNKILESS